MVTALLLRTVKSSAWMCRLDRGMIDALPVNLVVLEGRGYFNAFTAHPKIQENKIYKKR